MFSERIKELRIRSRIPQRQLAAVLDIDTATYCKREQVGVIAQILHADKNELVKLWLADKVYDIVSKESNAQDVLNMVNENIGKYGQSI